MHFLKSLRLDNFLSFPPGSAAIPLTPLNVIIGPNGSGKSNLIEALRLLNATPTAFASAIRSGGGAREWLWKGADTQSSACIEAILSQKPSANQPHRDLRYRLEFAAAGQRTEVIDEVIEEAEKRSLADKDVFFFYRFQKGNPIITKRDAPGKQESPTPLERHSLKPDESVLSQRKEPDIYPELSWVSEQFSQIEIYTEWGFGRHTEARYAQAGDLPSDRLLPDSRNLGLVLNQLEHANAGIEFNRLLAQFLPRYQRFSTLIQGGTVQLYLHEHGLNTPVHAIRVSDGTIRFMAILAILLAPNPPPLICIEEPELGLHPDAMTLLADLLKAASTRTQLIVTTHSDALISALSDDANCVLVCEYRKGTVLRRVEPEKLQDWLDQYRLGEIWRIGELGGNP